MKTVDRPTFYLLAETQVNIPGVLAYLNELGATEWQVPDVDDAALLTEIMGRLCYRSWQPGLNPNVLRVRADSAAYIRNLIDSGHGSVFEHATVSFAFHQVSRVFTHELVRHRVGTAMSQESMRYMRLTDIPFWVPPSLLNDEDLERRAKLLEWHNYLIDAAERFQSWSAEAYHLDDPTVDFHHKKEATSAFRRWLPTGVATEIGFTFNIRELRHVLRLRTDASAEEEMRMVVDDLATFCKARYPLLLADIERSQTGQWK